MQLTKRTFFHASTALVVGLLAHSVLPDSAVAQSRADLMSEHRGGTMVLTAVSAAGTVDPMINYTAQF